MKAKHALTAGILALCLGSSGCLGPDSAYSSVRQWNADLSDQDWVGELVYLGFWILPVYPIALIGDGLIFNPIRYWTGEPTINDPGAFHGFEKGD